ncbi:MAG: cold-shock protein [Bordetella sp.]|uniref:cold-shock protein n=1 Tax=Brevundimonas diminuta TaxID=293 RepID=UPI000AED0AF7|nr:cold shock domain-containing protein [Brevundimonas diminuta]MBN9479518.1 cold-shock protein [Bordetella sp.]
MSAPVDHPLGDDADDTIMGTIKFVDPKGRFAMISRDDKLPKVFVHLSAAQDAGLEGLVKGQRLSFRLRHQPDGRTQATDISAI